MKGASMCVYRHIYSRNTRHRHEHEHDDFDIKCYCCATTSFKSKESLVVWAYTMLRSGSEPERKGELMTSLVVYFLFEFFNAEDSSEH